MNIEFILRISINAHICESKFLISTFGQCVDLLHGIYGYYLEDDRSQEPACLGSVVHAAAVVVAVEALKSDVYLRSANKFHIGWFNQF